MDIVLGTIFANSLLPRVPQPGFSDTFNRAAGPIGVTTGEGRPWKLFSNGEAPGWKVTSVGTATITGTGGSISLAVVDALANNGTLSIKAVALGSFRRGGLAFRAADENNHYAVFQASPSSPLSLFKRVGGAATTLATSTYTPSDGDVLTATMFNANITIKANGSTIMTATDSTHQGETNHGLYGSRDAFGMGWDDVSFSPS